MNNYRYLHFTLGPVQGFVAQARRTRDLWAGSFLLSYLTGQAMYAVIKEQGKIIFPVVEKTDSTAEDLLLRAIIDQHEKNTTDKAPHVGTLPNRFKAKITAPFDPHLCVMAVQNAWENIAQAVWHHYVKPIAAFGQDVETIWQRQIKNFWDMAWVVTDDYQQNDVLDRRKNWRSHITTLEPGDKCTISGHLQELSGYIRTQNRQARMQQQAFWRALRAKTNYNLRPDERLCAVSLVKRLFPLVAEETIGWELPQSYPSTVYIAASSWLAQQISDPKKQEITTRYAQTVQQLLPEHIKRQDYMAIKNITELVQQNPGQKPFAGLDGNLFYPHIIENDLIWPENTTEKRHQIKAILAQLGPAPGPYYAMVLMDGDNMGRLLQTKAGNQVSTALAGFAQKVPAIVQQNNGILIFAGGDDVLALTPLEDAINMTTALRAAYVASFSGITDLSKDQTTISAAIILAHHHAPLKSVFLESYRLLEQVAKDQTGRDSLAICIWNTAGPNLEWSNPWDKVLDDNGNNLLHQLTQYFIGTSAEDSHYNSSFFYNIRSRWPILTKVDQTTQTGETLQLDAVKLLVAEYMKNPDRVKISLEETTQRMERLLNICRCYQRVEQVAANSTITADSQFKNTLNINGALLVRFLANKGVSQ